jgi:hypothetical protein
MAEVCQKGERDDGIERFKSLDGGHDGWQTKGSGGLGALRAIKQEQPSFVLVRITGGQITLCEGVEVRRGERPLRVVGPWAVGLFECHEGSGCHRNQIVFLREEGERLDEQSARRCG